MDELKRLDNNQYAYLHQLPISKLLELLDVAPVPASCPEDEAYVDALEEAIIEKEKENPTGLFPDIDQQWEQFVTHYLPDLEDAASEPERTENAVFEQARQQSLEVPPKRVVRFSRKWRTVLVAVAAIVCTLAIMVTVQATGVNIFGAMARWTGNIFSFGQIVPDGEVSYDPTQETAVPETDASGTKFSSLQEAFDAYGMTEVHEPAWLPEGYTLDRVDILAVDDPFLRTFSADYTDGEGRVYIDILSYEGEPNVQVQKTDSPVEVMEKYGIMFYYIENSVGGTLAWCTDCYEYYISSEEEMDILLQIAVSMLNEG